MSEESDFDFAAELATMDDIQTGSELLPEDDYNFVVVKAQAVESSNKNPGVKLFLEIIDGPYRGKQLIHDAWYSTRTQAGIEFFWRQMKALGITSAWARQTGNTTTKRWAELAVGAQLVASVKHEEYLEVVRARTNIKKAIGTNPKIAQASAGGSSQAATPAATLPPLEDDEYQAAPAAPSAEPVSVGAAVDADDPWGADS